MTQQHLHTSMGSNPEKGSAWRRPQRSAARQLSTGLLFALGGVAAVCAQSTADAPASAVTELSLEQLINLEVTSVGKKETSLLRAPAAVAVLTAEDINRLGATTIPEALRAVPGMQVARISANRWAVSARGMNDEYSNKLLVLIDGRSVYTPLFGGVHWNVQDVVLEDLERIEIIRGPGATLWGANAVNGVINIMTKSAKETQGALVSASGGTEDQPSVTARYGGTISSNLYYRVYGKYFRRDSFEDAHGNSMSDEWDMGRGGMRLDWEPSEQNLFTLSGDYFSGTFGEQVGKASVYPVPAFENIGVDAAVSGGNVLGRWTSRFSEDSELKVQAYYDGYRRELPFGGGVLVASPDEFAPNQNKLVEHRDTWDIDLQHRFKVLGWNEFVWGLGFRRTSDRIEPRGVEQVWSRSEAEDDLFSAFVQDEIAIVEDRLSLTLGSKFEHNDYTGFEIQPSGRIAWTPTDHQTLWASIARAVRTPTRLERDVRVNIGAIPPMGPGQPPTLISVFGNPNAESEEMLAFELGYRIEPTRRLLFDVAAFFNSYEFLANVQGEGIPEFDETPPHFVMDYQTENGVDGYSYGSELMAQWQVTAPWRLTAGYTWWAKHFDRSPYYDVTNPKHQVSLRSTLQLGGGWEFNGAAYYVDDIRVLTQTSPSTLPVDGYFRLDLGVNWKATDNLEFSVWGQNLLDPGHPEFSSYKSPRTAEVPRVFYGKITFRF